jgi:hypothetical protein
MRSTGLFALAVLLASCAGAPSYQYFRGGDRVDQPGVSFVLPVHHKWAAIMRSTYQSAFGALDMPKNDTLIVSSSVYNVPPGLSKEDFLKKVQVERISGPKTGRFELLSNVEKLYEERAETCVLYKSASKDFGQEAKRGGEFSLFETIGMHCVHPGKPNVGVQVEFSRKAPPGTSYASFEAVGLAVLHSARFREF